MPTVFKPTYKDHKTGQTRESEFWYARIGGKRVPLKTKDKRIAERKAAEMERTAELGYDPQAMDRAKRRSILEHLTAFEDSLKDQGVGQGHLQNLPPRLRRIIDGCGIKTIADIDAAKVESWLASEQKAGMAVGTRKHYASNAKQFGRWLVATGRAGRNPFEGVRTDLNVDAGRTRHRRALSPADSQRFLASVRKSEKVLGRMAGEERYFLYALAVATGLRRNELGSLTSESFQLDSAPATVTIIGQWAKNRKTATLPLRADLAADLRAWLPAREPGQPLFPVRGRRMGYVIEADLAEAGLPYKVDGRVLDFHSLRGTFITHLGISGVPLVTAQRLARHSDPRLTSNTYTHLGLADLAQAVEKLPPLAGEPPAPAPAPAVGGGGGAAA